MFKNCYTEKNMLSDTVRMVKNPVSRYCAIVLQRYFINLKITSQKILASSIFTFGVYLFPHSNESADKKYICTKKGDDSMKCFYCLGFYTMQSWYELKRTEFALLGVINST